jgi:hypothetical protein
VSQRDQKGAHCVDDAIVTLHRFFSDLSGKEWAQPGSEETHKEEHCDSDGFCPRVEIDGSLPEESKRL